MKNERLLGLIEERIRQVGVTEAALSQAVAGHGTVVTDLRRGSVPSVERLEKICAVLGLEFYVGPPRPEAEALRDSLRQTAEQLERLREQEMEAAGQLERLREWALEAAGQAVPGPRPALADEETAALSSEVEFPAVRQIEVMELAAAAGGGAEIDFERVVSRVAFRRDWLDEQGLDPTQCVVIGVMGESMEPTLPQGCSILVDRSRRRRRQGHVFVIRGEYGIVVKRVSKDKRGRWRLLSDHPEWAPQSWPPGAEIIGEVKWMARTLG